MKLLFSTILICFSFIVFGQSPLGVWKSIDDETKEEKSNVTIYEENGKLHGKITKIYPLHPM